MEHTNIGEGVQWVGRFYRMGASAGVILPKALREEMGLRVGDWFLIVPHRGALVLRRLRAEEVCDVNQFPDAVFERMGKHAVVAKVSP